ncbi:hypothetical protein AN220_17580 [Streptomyces nanshensis]|nr:hypothetical protein AN220_17580 [Streptomyces nanshensis]
MAPEPVGLRPAPAPADRSGAEAVAAHQAQLCGDAFGQMAEPAALAPLPPARPVAQGGHDPAQRRERAQPTHLRRELVPHVARGQYLVAAIDPVGVCRCSPGDDGAAPP